ncbi:helix-turn-helix domain-containing protein [Rhizobium alvei]|uniref:Helix-turn-helix domain-containing protein n=1 Tax=Rhizobium alvei TaxID=1132659 RepID=A0ABT8YIH7_9HYPH|nr:helix-turn-helix domain-containing protein [Rhizobium alvei]MDO6963431.1 helix-turn-helix domain-containing protein [Rhizobium alvei]
MVVTVPSVHFDTAQYPEAERFDIWRSAVTTHQVSRPLDDPAPFQAVVDAWTLGDLVLTHSRIGAACMFRNEEMARLDGRDWVQVVLLISGRVDFDTGDGAEAQTLRPGELAVFDALRYLRTDASAAECITCTISRRPFVKAGFDPYSSHGVRVDGAFGRLIADFLNSLVRQAPAMLKDEIETVPSAFVALLVSALKAKGPGKARTAGRGAASLRRRAEIHIEQSLTSDRLDLRSLAKDLAASEASLYRAFCDQGGVRNYIRRRRLETIHARIGGDVHAIGDIARDFGFASAAHFSRAFKKQYGFPPRRAKLMQRRLSFNADVDEVSLFRQWKELLGPQGLV